MAIEAPVWFDEKFYLNAKADQLNAIKYNGKSDWTGDAVKASLGEMSAYDHYMAFGAVENISPSPMFNVAEYLKAKADQLNADKYDGKTDWTEAKVLESFKAAGMSAWDHYVKFGMSEGLNPSNMFDNDAYLAAKADALNAAKHEGKTDWTADDVAAAFKAAGMTPVQHYYEFGKTEGLKAPQVDPADRVISSYDPYKPVNPGKTYDLTSAKDTIEGTDNDDVINGVSSALNAERTLNAEDVIDGKGGNDTLNVDMKGSFSGFTTGSMTNVENVVLNAEGSAPLSFNAEGITGVENWTLNSKTANMTLNGLGAAGITVNVQGLQTGNATINFTDKAVEGDSDALTLGLSSVGTAQKGTTPADYVAVAANGIEDLTVKVTGDNYADLTNAATDSITVKGAGNLDVSAVNADLDTFDASLLSGNVKADLTGATMQVVKGGAGDDTFIVDKLAATAELDGGEGNDTLVLKGLSGTLQPTMKGFENIAIDGTGVGTLTISGKNVSDFTGLTLQGSTASTVKLANVNAPAFTVTSSNTAASSVTLSDATAVTYNTQASDAALKDKTSHTVQTDINAANATSATVNVGAYTAVTGSLNFGTAKGDLSINVASGMSADGKDERTSFGGTVTANSATGLNIKADGNLAAATYNVDKAESVIINAAKGSTGAQDINAKSATTVSITAGKGLDIQGSDLSAAQSVTLVQNDGELNGTGVALNAVNKLTVSGKGENSKVTLGVLSNNANYGITVDASGLEKGFTATSINTAGNVALNLDEMTGAFVVGAIGGKDVNINAATMGTTKTGAITATGNVHVDAMGVLGGDETHAAVDLGAIGATGDVSLLFDGSSDMTFGAIVGKSVTIDASGYLGNIGNSVTAAAEAVFGTINAATVTIKGSEIGTNTFDTGSAITADTLNYTGGLEVDTVTVDAKNAGKMNVTLNTGGEDDVVKVNGIAGTTDIVVKGDMGGDAADKITVDGTDAATSVIDLSGLKGYATSSILAQAGKLTGGMGADTFTIEGGAGASATSSYVLHGGAGADTYDYTAATGKTVITVDDFKVAEGDNVSGFTGVQMTAAQVVAYLLAAFNITAVAGDITFADGADATQAVYNGNSYLFTATASADGEGALQLIGVTADVTDHIA